MIPQIRTALVLMLVMTVLAGLVYPLLMTAISQVIFPFQANGSLLKSGMTVVGSELIGQSFDQCDYFWGRLSATTPMPYNGSGSTGSNLGPLNPALIEEVKGRLVALRTDTSDTTRVPVDLCTSSASGLDPDITPAGAYYQIPRVAAARSLAPDMLRQLIAAHIEPRQFGVLGDPRVNVLALNRWLDSLSLCHPDSAKAE